MDVAPKSRNVHHASKYGRAINQRKIVFCIIREYILLGMDIRFLDTLVTVIECGSVAEAARRLNLTAAGVAQRVHVLESEIGVSLVTRAGRTVRPTAAAVAILERSKNIQRDIRDLKSVASSGLLSGELRLGVMPTMLTGFLPDVLRAFGDAHPDIEIQVIRAPSAEVYRKLSDGQIDAAITSEPPFAMPKTFAWSFLREEPFVVLAPRGMKLRHPHTMLANEPFIRLDRNVYAGQRIDRYLRSNGIRPHERLELDGLDAIAIMVDRGIGVSLLPDWPPPWPAGLKLQKVPLPGRPLTRRIGLCWARASLRLGLIDIFLHHAQLAPERTGHLRASKSEGGGVRTVSAQKRSGKTPI
jgi:DNA-binding transcriptional LysR family regulator